MLTVAPAPATVTGRDAPLAAMRASAGSGARWAYAIRPARFKALTATIAVHILIVVPGLYGWHRSGQLPAPRDAIVVTLPAMPNKPAQKRERGAEQTSPQPPAPKPLVPAMTPMPLDIAIESVAQPQITANGGQEGQLAEMTQAYRQAVSTRLAAQRYYPQEALLHRYEGTGKILFRIDRTGRLLEVAIKTSTGWQVLDHAAVDQVRRAAPFPPIPAELPDELVVSLPLEFLILGGPTMVAAR